MTVYEAMKYEPIEFRKIKLAYPLVSL